MHIQKNLGTIVLAVLAVAGVGCHGGAKAAGTSTAPIITAATRAQAKDVIRTAFASSQTVEVLYACEVVADTGLREFAPQLERLLRSDSVPARFAAAMAIGDLKYLAAKPAIEAALNDADENVRIAAIYAMSRFGAGSGHARGVYEGLSSRDQTIRANAAMVLGKLRDPAALTALYWALSDKDSDQDTRTQVAYSIALTGDEKIYPKLWTLLISSYANYRIQGVEAMGALNDAQARGAVLTMLKDETLEVRLAAAEQLGVMKDSSGEKVVLDYLKSSASSSDGAEAERRNVRAARAVGSIGTAELAAYLPQLLRDRSPIVRLAGAQSAFKLYK
jgi:HEAT repeat protein